MLAHIHWQHMPQLGIDGPKGFPSPELLHSTSLQLCCQLMLLLELSEAGRTTRCVCECKPEGGCRQCFCLQVCLSGADNTHTHVHLNFFTSKHNDSLHIIHDPGLLNCNRLERACRFRVRRRKTGVTSCTVKERKREGCRREGAVESSIKDGGSQSVREVMGVIHLTL